MSTDNGPFVLWQESTTDTEALFVGSPGRAYAFYSVAIDNVGHIEPAPMVADAETTVIMPETTLDIDANGTADALTDGILILRYLFDFRGDPLVEGVVAPDATRTDPAEIIDYLHAGRDTMLDVDANGEADALTDGIIILRYLFDFIGDPLVESALGTTPPAQRTDPAEIITFLDGFNPTIAPSASPLPNLTDVALEDDLSNDIYSALAYEATVASRSLSSTFESDQPTQTALLSTYDQWN